ncbi:hypothetical protein [Leekyejoonella antrihumi]|uniref:Uncharacterized protein n=1 Tax=Leekyejoonella antrihumi TaxID=1660198 RepID=A0A563DRS4_9MICO|nr:hypothetical protein [Leekyejoonella antrihumi]TWP32947.1 hypothetical protein FGL98_22945 [Leekyejoonella antrihumi]
MPSGPSPSPAAQAQQVLRELDSDRACLASRLAAPWWLYPVCALLVAGFIATPAIRADEPRNALVGVLIASTLVLLLGYQRLSGVRVGRAGLRGGLLIAGLLVATLVLLSVSFGLAASMSAWWVLAPAAASFLMVQVGGRRFDCLYRENLSRGHSASV